MLTGLGIKNGDQGEVIAIGQGLLRHPFQDGTTSARCFGFELQLYGGESKVA
jgi:hypothetical protein